MKINDKYQSDHSKLIHTILKIHGNTIIAKVKDINRPFLTIQPQKRQ